jgi:hypothetical protein
MHTGYDSYTGKNLPLVTGLSLLTMAIVAGLGYGYAFPQIYIRDNAPATFTNLAANNALFICLVLSFLLIFLLDLLLCWLLYRLFRRTDRRMAIFMALTRLMYTGILGWAIIHLLMIPSHIADTTGAADIVMDHFESFLTIWSLGLLVFGLHLVLLGCLLTKTTAMPRLIGYIAVFAGLCYLVTNIATQYFPHYAEHSATVDLYLALPMALGELLPATWFLVKRERWNKLAGPRYVSPDMA